MIGIENISVYLPETVIDNVSRVDDFNVTKDFIVNKIGVKEFRISNLDEKTSDLSSYAVQMLLLDSGVSIDKIKCLVVVTQTPDGGGIPHVSALVHGKCGMSKDVICFDISLGCSGYVYGLSIMRSIMRDMNIEFAILVTCDPYTKIVNPDDKNTSLLFGDAATATLLSNKSSLQIKDAVLSTDGTNAKHLNNEDGYLHMNGRQVFNFVMQEVPDQINNLLKKIGLNKNDIDKYIFHQGSKFIINGLTKRLGLNSKQVPIKIEDVGNTVSSTIPIVLQEYIDDDSIDRMLLSGFGVGLSWGSMLIERTIK